MIPVPAEQDLDRRVQVAERRRERKLHAAPDRRLRVLERDLQLDTLPDRARRARRGKCLHRTGHVLRLGMAARAHLGESFRDVVVAVIVSQMQHRASSGPASWSAAAAASAPTHCQSARAGSGPCPIENRNTRACRAACGRASSPAITRQAGHPSSPVISASSSAATRSRDGMSSAADRIPGPHPRGPVRPASSWGPGTRGLLTFVTLKSGISALHGQRAGAPPSCHALC